ncbi:MAG: HEPN domain-containing protein [Methanosarcinales archaeon]
MNEQVHEWIAKAEEDFKAAQILPIDEFPNIIAFHCQQCAEKYLKAILITNGKTPPKIHDLIKLNDLLLEIDERFDECYELL